MIGRLLLSAPVAACVFMALTYGLYWLGGKLAPLGEDHPGKRQPYACGEDLLPPEEHLTYHAFFQLALMFGLLHLASVMIATVPSGGGVSSIALAYLLVIVVSVLVLTRGRQT